MCLFIAIGIVFRWICGCEWLLNNRSYNWVMLKLISTEYVNVCAMAKPLCVVVRKRSDTLHRRKRKPLYGYELLRKICIFGCDECWTEQYRVRLNCAHTLVHSHHVWSVIVFVTQTQIVGSFMPLHMWAAEFHNNVNIPRRRETQFVPRKSNDNNNWIIEMERKWWWSVRTNQSMSSLWSLYFHYTSESVRAFRNAAFVNKQTIIIIITITFSVCAWYAMRIREYDSARSENENWEITPNCPKTLSIVPYAYDTHVSCRRVFTFRTNAFQRNPTTTTKTTTQHKNIQPELFCA